MKKKSTSKSAFFNLRVLIGVVVVLAGVFLALLGFGTFVPGQAEEAIGQRVGQMTVIPAVHSDVSRPLREQPVQWPQVREEREPNVHARIPNKHKDAPAPMIQSSFWQPLMPPAIPAPTRQWAGIAATGSFPPDTTGAVGKTQYVQTVNVSLQVFNKVTGASLLGPVPIDVIWFGFGGTCQFGGRGDPVVMYDQLADRWIISQMAKPSTSTFAQNECIAISQTGDATGAWYRYDFHLTTPFLDYPKLGVWPDGYYMAVNLYVAPNRRFISPAPFVFDRAKMLVGDPTATAQTPAVFIPGISEETFLPSYLDGMLPPPPGAPNHFVSFPQVENDPPKGAQFASLAYRVWAFHVDWDYPANSTFSLEASVPAGEYTALCPDTIKCVPQLDTSQTDWLDGLGDRLMFRNAYRRFPDDHESMLNNFTVSTNSVAGIRWFELRRAPSGSWGISQENIYQPDSTWRWFGSIASDNQGNIALGFSASSATIHPQIRYAGRLATDPPNILSGEQHLFDGTGSQKASDNRWGDYTDMTVDPVDDCSFYYVNEYYRVTEKETWSTRIGYFRFPQCTAPQKGTAHFVVTPWCGSDQLANALVSIDGRPYGATLSDGTYDAVLTPGSHSYAVSNPAFATQRGNFTISNGETTLVAVCLGGKAAVSDFNGDGHPDYVLRNTSTRQTAIWYLNNNVFIGSAFGPTLPAAWGLTGVADFNRDNHPDYALFTPRDNRTGILYLSGPALIGAAFGPTLPTGWELVATGDFNGDGYPDYVLYNLDNRRTAIWYLNNNVLVNAAYGPTIPADWALIAVADFNSDGHPDYVLYNMSTRRTAIWYLNNSILVNALYGPTLPAGWAVVAAGDFNGDGHPDYVLYNWTTQETAIWYLNDNVLVNAAYGPTLQAGWSLIAP